jgi:hypothetical protein
MSNGKPSIADLIKSAMSNPTKFEKPIKERERPEYFAKTEWISNSYLSYLDCESKGLKYTEPPRGIFEFGSAFDALITEPATYKQEDYSLAPYHFEQMAKMKELLVREKSVLFTSNTALQKEYYIPLVTPCGTVQAKCKTDLEIVRGRKKSVYDLKTTTCKTLREFMSKIFAYAYDRAGAWYTDVAGADFYSLIVCNYTNKDEFIQDFKHEVWQIDFTPQMLKIGREEYLRILKYAIDNGLVKTL